MIQIIKGKVINGYSVGNKFLFKTANIVYDSKKIQDGVYKINVIVDEKKYAGVGATVEKKGVFEANLFDFEGDLYGKKIEIFLLKKLRDNKKFDDFESLKKQINQDILNSKNIVFKVMTFGTFDIFHDGHKHFLNEAKNYGDELITIIARNKNVEKFKGKLPKNDENTRLQILKSQNISDIVELGSLEKPFLVLEKYNPDVICLGYDQVGFYDLMKKDLRFNGIEVIRLKSYKPEIYKSSLL